MRVQALAYRNMALAVLFRKLRERLFAVRICAPEFSITAFRSSFRPKLAVAVIALIALNAVLRTFLFGLC